MQDRFAVAADLKKIARLLRIKGENLFKAQAYERAASALENLEGDFDALVKAGRLQEIPGVGRRSQRLSRRFTAPANVIC